MSNARVVYSMSIDDMKKRVEYVPDTGKFFLLSYGFSSLKDGSKYQKYKAGDRIREITVTDKDGYVKISIKGSGASYIRAHRYAWAYTYGEFPSEDIDHINGIYNDNRISNLRLAPNGDNARNLKKPNTNTSGIVGVSYNKKDKRWRAYIWKDGKQVNLGGFKNIDDAIEARKKAETNLKYHLNHGR